MITSLRAALATSALAFAACTQPSASGPSAPREAAPAPAASIAVAGSAAPADLPSASAVSRAAPAPATEPAPPATAVGAAESPDLGAIDTLVRNAIDRGATPGAVIAVVRNGSLAWLQAYGLRARKPVEEPCTLDTLYDLGSLTKAIATAPSVMLLVDRGLVALDAPVARYVPEFGQGGKERITVEQLLLHTGGLLADNHLRDYQQGTAEALARILRMAPHAPAGSRFEYSDLGYIVLGLLVERVSGRSLDRFAREEIFEPLGMRDTMFQPPAQLRGRIAPTSLHEGSYLRGEPSDPRAMLLGGVAGHAGLFSTGADLARFSRMMLGKGQLDAVRLLREETFARWTQPRPVPPAARRALGWDVDSSYSSNRGQLPGGLGHTGWPGTSIWLVPSQAVAVIVLTNRRHPDDAGPTVGLSAGVASAVARTLRSSDRAAR